MLDYAHGSTLTMALIVAVVDQGKSEKVIEVIEKVGSKGKFIMQGHGTASEEIWERLGITKNRDVVIFVTLFNKVDMVSNAIISNFDRKKKNQGMVFSVPINNIMGNSVSLNIVKKDEKTDGDINQKVEEIMHYFNEKMKQKQENCDSELIIVRMANGYGQEIMDCARKAGAIGGTIVNGLIPPKKKEGQFFKITLATEGDILFMIVDKKVSGEVLEAISAEYGTHTPARAFGFAVPVLSSTMISE